MNELEREEEYINSLPPEEETKVDLGDLEKNDEKEERDNKIRIAEKDGKAMIKIHKIFDDTKKIDNLDNMSIRDISYYSKIKEAKVRNLIDKYGEKVGERHNHNLYSLRKDVDWLSLPNPEFPIDVRKDKLDKVNINGKWERTTKNIPLPKVLEEFEPKETEEDIRA